MRRGGMKGYTTSMQGSACRRPQRHAETRGQPCGAKTAAVGETAWPRQVSWVVLALLANVPKGVKMENEE